MADFKDQIAKLLGNLPGLQAQMREAQDKVSKVTAEGSSGGGIVVARVNGSHRLESLKIDPIAVDARDVPMLEDLVRAAVNQAHERVNEAVKEEVSMAAGGLPMGNLGSLFGDAGDDSGA